MVWKKIQAERFMVGEAAGGDGAAWPRMICFCLASGKHVIPYLPRWSYNGHSLLERIWLELTRRVASTRPRRDYLLSSLMNLEPSSVRLYMSPF